MVEDEGPSSFSTCQRWIHDASSSLSSFWDGDGGDDDDVIDDDGGDDDVIDDYGDDEEFAWYSHLLGISVLNRRSNPIPSKLVLPSCLIVQPPTNMVFRVK